MTLMCSRLPPAEDRCASARCKSIRHIHNIVCLYMYIPNNNASGLTMDGYLLSNIRSDSSATQGIPRQNALKPTAFDTRRWKGRGIGSTRQAAA